MERIELRYDDMRRALGTLRDVLNEPFSVVVRDATIQRFEYTFEALWKFLKDYLQQREGVLCNSPKHCFREAFSARLIEEADAVRFLQMTDDRNLTSHTYKEEVAAMLYGRVREYCGLMEKLVQKIKMEKFDS